MDDDSKAIARRILERIMFGGSMSATEKTRIIDEEIRKTGKFSDAEFIQKRIEVANAASMIRMENERVSLRRAS